MGWIEELRRKNQTTSQPQDQFAEAARRRWAELGDELKADVTEFNNRGEDAEFSRLAENRYQVRNPSAGLQLDMIADIQERVVRYDYSVLSNASKGVPEGGMLSIRQSRSGGADFYSSDERLTSEEARQVLLEPVLFPPQMAA
ncbi:MAG TPA: hypothetical protein VJN64_11560 [Terriglobales bacterium]|nr:hypothetical protein [Terriglobales bacterium]